MAEVCTHIDQIHNVKPKTKGCEECLKMGDSWVHLRLCLSCGHVGCCDSSKNKHASKHYRAVKHPIVRSIEPGENWMWCYVDELMFEEGKTKVRSGKFLCRSCNVGREEQGSRDREQQNAGHCQ